ncbi:MAG: sulfurtransferase TusA family protein [Proteobacteria bacterium]|nr:sulfurtransferase TusA family protein [Pseudomonadota bacterium]
MSSPINPRVSTPAILELDARGLLCPLPVLKARKALADMAAGETLAVLADDPVAPLDFADFCQTSGHTLLEQSVQSGKSGQSGQAGDVIRFVISKGGKHPRQ